MKGGVYRFFSLVIPYVIAPAVYFWYWNGRIIVKRTGGNCVAGSSPLRKFLFAFVLSLNVSNLNFKATGSFNLRSIFRPEIVKTHWAPLINFSFLNSLVVPVVLLLTFFLHATYEKKYADNNYEYVIH